MMDMKGIELILHLQVAGGSHMVRSFILRRMNLIL
jgi:hypothetical protein